MEYAGELTGQLSQHQMFTAVDGRIWTRERAGFYDPWSPWVEQEKSQMDECFNAICGYDDDHDHGPMCTTDCPCGEGEVEL